jgi:integrase
VLPYWSDRSVAELSRRDVRALLERVCDRGSPIMANRVLAVVRKMLAFAVEEDWLNANPAAAIKKPGSETSRERVLTVDELARVWRCLDRLPTTDEKPAPRRKRAAGTPDDRICPVTPAHAAILKIRFLSAQRGGEVARMRWQDLDDAALTAIQQLREGKTASEITGGWWTIPKDHTKNKRAHRVPLTPRMLALIAAQQREGEAVFSDAAHAGNRVKKAAQLVARALELADFRGHDLRRTAATKMGEVGIPRQHIAYVLNHADGAPASTHVYDRYEHDLEKRVALETLDRVLTTILAGPATAAVVPFARSR